MEACDSTDFAGASGLFSQHRFCQYRIKRGQAIACQKPLAETAAVDVHRRNIMRKLDRHSVAELTRYVIENEGSEPD